MERSGLPLTGRLSSSSGSVPMPAWGIGRVVLLPLDKEVWRRAGRQRHPARLQNIFLGGDLRSLSHILKTKSGRNSSALARCERNNLSGLRQNERGDRATDLLFNVVRRMTLPSGPLPQFFMKPLPPGRSPRVVADRSEGYGRPVGDPGALRKALPAGNRWFESDPRRPGRGFPQPVPMARTRCG